MRTALSLRTLAAAALTALVTLAACHLTPVGSPLTAQATAPEVALDSTLGPLRSPQALAGGPLVLVFYRGHW
jgi:hypothetical protein